MREAMGPRSVGVDGDPEVDGNRNYDSRAPPPRDGVRRDGRRGDLPEHPAAVRAPRRRSCSPRPRSATRRSTAGPGSAPTTAGSPTSAPRRPAGAPASRRSCSPTSTAPSRRSSWAREHGLSGGVLLPGAPPGSGVEPIYAADYEPIWAACEDFGMPLNHHAGGGVPDFGPHFPASMAMFMLEVTWWGHRALWHLMFSGVFERHPDAAVHDDRDRLGVDRRHAGRARLLLRPDEARRPGVGGDLRRPDRSRTSRSARASTSRASAISGRASCGRSSARCATRSASTRSCGAPTIRTSRAAYPYTRLHLRRTFAGVDPDEVARHGRRQRGRALRLRPRRPRSRSRTGSGRRSPRSRRRSRTPKCPRRPTSARRLAPSTQLATSP